VHVSAAKLAGVTSSPPIDNDVRGGPGVARRGHGLTEQLLQRIQQKKSSTAAISKYG
jgi:hypothetical protein